MPPLSLFSPILIGILASGVVLFLMTRGRLIMLRACAILFAISFGIGFIFYTLAYLSPDAGVPGALWAALRGLFSTGRMFLINDDYGFLIDAREAQWLVSNLWLQIIFWLGHVLALVVSISTITALFGRKLIDGFRLRFGQHRAVYILAGNSKNMLALGESIATHNHKQKPDAKRLVVFALSDGKDSEEFYKNAAGFSGMVCLGDGGELLSCLRKAGLGRFMEKRRYYKVILPPEYEGASSVCRRIEEYAEKAATKADCLELFVLTPSEWEREKIQEISHGFPYTLHLTDEATLAARQMVQKHSPYCCIPFDKGKAVRDFTVLILGFGAVGQAAFLRLVMNGQFENSRMRAVIVDADMERLAARFSHRYPGITLCCDIEFRALDVREEAFFELLACLSPMDYVVIALGSDTQSMQAALDLQAHFLRTVHEGISPVIAVKMESEGVLAEGIFCFGWRENLYCEALIIDEEADRLAMAINSIYMRGLESSAQDAWEMWHKLDWFTQESNRASADYIPAMLHLAGISAQQAASQDKLTDESALAETLARTEHLRWMAFHAAMGWRPMNLDEMRHRFDTLPNDSRRLALCRRDPAQKAHLCLVPWEELDEISEAYTGLARRTANAALRDFKADDYQVVQNVPLFLRASQ